MGMRQTRRLQRVERARNMYVGTLLAVGLPRKLRSLSAENRDAPIRVGEPHFDWYCAGWRGNIAQFYVESFGVTFTGPSAKAQKRFVRGFTAWCRKEFHGPKSRIPKKRS